MRLILSPLIALFFVACTTTAAIHAESSQPPLQAGWHEVVVSVSNLDAWLDMWPQITGWEVVSRDELEPASFDGFGQTDNLGGRQALLHNPGTDTGYLRLIEFASSQSEQIRPNAQSWDTGGWFDFNVRVTDLDAKSKQLLALGWQGYSNPVQFSFGPFIVKEWLARGPDGVIVAFIERVAPPLSGWPHLKDVSRVFNSTQIVVDIDESYDFYANKLGFETYLEHVGTSSEPGENVLGLPQNITTEIERKVRIIHPQGENTGSIELLQFVGATGRDLSGRTDPPNVGILALRFPVQSAAILREHIVKQNVSNVTPIRTTEIPPYGAVPHFAVRGPNGEWLEFIELDTKQR